MCTPRDPEDAAYDRYRSELVAAGLLIPLGVPGAYGLSGTLEHVIEQFERLVTKVSAPLAPEVMRFPPLLSRTNYLATDHLRNFPNLMGSIHSFAGGDRQHFALLEKQQAGGDWAGDLAATDLMLTPATCYPLYPTAKGTLPPQGRLVDLRSFVFRHEPSPDPARMQMFRMREFVRLGTPEQALEHRDHWLKTCIEIFRAVGLDVKPVVANDPFFGRAGKMMAASQKEQDLKFELVATVACAERPTAIASCNCHLDHFGHAFDIHTADSKPAHSACIGFGLERVALALFRAHGFDPSRWPSGVKQVLDL
ncbi:MAG: amino acid--[acyl-carrier-protein] ligase [Gemmataceae bacterium]